MDNVPAVSCIQFESTQVRDDWIKAIQRNITAQNDLSVSRRHSITCRLALEVHVLISTLSHTKTSTFKTKAKAKALKFKIKTKAVKIASRHHVTGLQSFICTGRPTVRYGVHGTYFGRCTLYQ